ncbi:microtubule associated protein eb1 [Plasmopara halstedii]|uniref:Microtubule associated protein eb1 n=1 Tax=Plasmopara halstedii TaxID=4781 RepID=A0A0P1A9J2_PLAHL|nr:microtubule associated protein eb1 [Plasmopara halstedii]CEG36999.1 microtubule associated protein eb1 [Plasmopara halstedii]|eukprot:XP_024573368.1 microtubule associated protein eb1 [Plasmopara halstedii]
MADQSMSLMDGTYFVGRKEILDWINTLCGISLSKVEQTCTGAVACQILDAMYPGKVQMSKVDWSANKDYEYIQNYKVLQKAFMQLKIDKHVEVDRLVRGKYQDNLEFMQWFKAFYERNASGQPYDPVAQREKGKGGAQYTQKYGGTSAAGPAVPLRRKVGAATTSRVGRTPPGAPTAARAGRTSTGASRRPIGTTTMTAQIEVDTEAAVAAATAPLEKELEELTATNEALTNEGGELRAMVESLEKERDFYFNKLREVEIMLQSAENSEANPLAQSIFKVLYATEDEGGEDEQVAEEPQDEQM